LLRPVVSRFFIHNVQYDHLFVRTLSFLHIHCLPVKRLHLRVSSKVRRNPTVSQPCWIAEFVTELLFYI
jgi:hypothetical protein